MRWAGRRIEEVSRAVVIGAVGAFAKAVTSFFNRTTVSNADTLLHLVTRRRSGVPLLTVTNHMSTLDDPLMWGFKTFPITDAKLARWALAAEDICFKNSLLSYLFRLGKCIPVTRGAGIYQQHMNEALQILARGEWVMPEKPTLFFKRPLLPRCKQEIKIIIGNPLNFDLNSLKQTAISVSLKEKKRSVPSKYNSWPTLMPDGLDETAQKWLYSTISQKIQSALERLRTSI